MENIVVRKCANVVFCKRDVDVDGSLCGMCQRKLRKIQVEGGADVSAVALVFGFLGFCVFIAHLWFQAQH